MLRLAHISDLHFAHPNLNPVQLLSKRWLGNLNFVFKRKKAFDHQERLPALIDLFKQEKITHIAITGDISITSHPEEFKQGMMFTLDLQKAGFKTFIIPGNHDHYTAQAYRKKLFYRFFPDRFSSENGWNLISHGLTATLLQPHLWLVALDTAIPTSLFSSQGYFSEKMETHLNEFLQTVPKGDRVILLNHYPFFQNDMAKNRLKRGEALRKTLEQHGNVLLYLHGHTHRQIIADLRPSELPVISDPGSTAERTKGGCHLIELEREKISLRVFRWLNGWQCTQTQVM